MSLFVCVHCVCLCLRTMHSRLFSSLFSLQVVASKKVQHKEPFGPYGDVKWRKGADILGKTPKGKGVYQFVKKYGANVDGYSPIYAPNEWSEIGDSYARGILGLAIWAMLLRSLLLGGAFLVYNTNALASYIPLDL
ncbi:unnamed protein product [Sphagnum balticum]